MLIEREKHEKITNVLISVLLILGFTPLHLFAGGLSEKYCVLNDGVLTFFSDTKKQERSGVIYDVYLFADRPEDIPWYKDKLKKVVFDKSFYNVWLSSTKMWFEGQEELEEIVDLKYLNTNSVKNMNSMFSDCISLKSLDLSEFNTYNVTDMAYMFAGYSSETPLDISSFDVSNLRKCDDMFSDSSCINSILVNDSWNNLLSNVDAATTMFERDYNLKGGNGTKYSEKNKRGILLRGNSNGCSICFRNNCFFDFYCIFVIYRNCYACFGGSSS